MQKETPIKHKNTSHQSLCFCGSALNRLHLSAVSVASNHGHRELQLPALPCTVPATSLPILIGCTCFLLSLNHYSLKIPCVLCSL